MKQIFVFLLLTAAILSVSASYRRSRRCGRNAEFNACGTACPERCGEGLPKACTLQCVAGCFCRQGFVLDDNNRCIRPEHCPTILNKPKTDKLCAGKLNK